MRFRVSGLTSSALATKHAGNSNTEISGSMDNRSSNEDKSYEKDPRVHDAEAASDDDSRAAIDRDAQLGTQKVQAMTQVWSKRDLILAYIMIWLVAFILAFSSGIISTLTPYVTSSFQSHSLTALTGVISSLVSGLWKLPYAKIMDVWGRPQALSLMVASVTLGLIMTAGCNNVATYCAAQVFYYLGYLGIDFSITVFIADSSKLKNRGFMIAFAASPWLVTTWIYGYAANNILAPDGMGYRWGFGVFAIVVPLVCAPWIVLMWLKQIKAIKMGLVPNRPASGKTFAQSALYYATQFDVVGLLILATGLALFLLSFNLYSLQADQWRSPMIICFVIFGGLLIIAFALWEKFLAPATFVPWPLLKNRTVVGTMTMALALYTGWYIWDSYFYSLLIVLFNQSIVHATYISNIYTIGSCFICLVYGICLRYYGKLKWYSLFWGAPLTILGVGLMIAFRQPNVNIGYIVMCQIFVAFGGGVLVISEQTTLMAVSKQGDVPALLAVESMVIAVGSAIGSTIAGAMWTGIFPAQLTRRLPADALSNFAEIYGDFTVQSSYPVGSPTRDAINESYAYTQRYMLIGATCIYLTMLLSIALWQNVDVKKQKQRTYGLL